MLKFKNTNTVFLGLFCLLVIYSFVVMFYWPSFVYLLLVWLTITTIGSFNIQCNYHLNSLNNNSSIKKNYITITFDDGPNPIHTPKILDLLNKHQAKATFFCIGKQIEKNPDLIKKILKQGHEIGNHSYTHANTFGFFNAYKIIDEVQKTNQIIKQLTGLKPKFFRPPFGVTNPNLKKALNSTNMQCIGWNKRSLDTTRLSKKQILKRITNKLQKGDIILLHDTSEKTASILEQLLLKVEEKKLQSVTIGQLFQLKAYA